jgi:pseudoazurin|tara:strand:- start:1860 stop:2459 length:600 start_codon:yes stop_codon:yes gene_type:complete
MRLSIRKNIYLLVLPICFLFIFNGKKYEDAVIARINVPVKICLEGQPCGKPAPTSSMESAANIDVKKIELSEGSEHVVKMLNMGDGGAMIFEPAVIKVSLGDTIHFKATDISHNSETITNMVPAGADGWMGALNEDISITIDTEGVYVYQCSPHAMLAMVGVIQVGEAVNLDDVKAAAQSMKSTFVSNSDRLDGYLAQL